MIVLGIEFTKVSGQSIWIARAAPEASPQWRDACVSFNLFEIRGQWASGLMKDRYDSPEELVLRCCCERHLQPPGWPAGDQIEDSPVWEVGQLFYLPGFPDVEPWYVWERSETEVLGLLAAQVENMRETQGLLLVALSRNLTHLREMRVKTEELTKWLAKQ